jgi:hypothetical protein
MYRHTLLFEYVPFLFPFLIQYGCGRMQEIVVIPEDVVGVLCRWHIGVPPEDPLKAIVLKGDE